MSPIDNTLILTREKLDEAVHVFIKRLDIYSPADREKIIAALEWARMLHKEQKRDSGEPYIIHPLRVAEILVEVKMDPTTIIGALLHDVLEDTEVEKSELSAKFGEEVGRLVDGVTKIDDMNVGGKSSRKAASLRKMVWAMVDDIRVIFIKLADKRHNMKTLQYVQEKERQMRTARECLDIYAPMAGKLGMQALQGELEDLSLKYLKPETYTQIQEHVILQTEERKQFLEKIQGDILQAAEKAGIPVKVNYRAKHFYSIYRKMKDRGKDLREIYDLLGIRIICKNSVACYTMLGVLHSLWAPVSGRFKDYIARPKPNGYQSLHTAVITDSGHVLEIQIRSQSMHESAEYGIAAHWAYKEGKTPEQIHPESLSVVRQLRTLREEGYEDAKEFLEAIKRDVLRYSIIVYTPKGDPIELPEGATAIDMAYHIHSEVGNHCMGAKANGSIIPLTRPLENTQTIQILTSPGARPHVNWLKHVRSSRARSKIRAWLNSNESGIIIDRNIVARRKQPREEDKSIRKTDQLPEKEPTAANTETQVRDKSKVGISIGSERNLMIQISKCCSPSPGDKIIGYISRGRGIVVHKPDCPNLKGITDFEERRIDVEWETASSRFTQRFRIHSRYTSDLFSAIEGAIRKHRGHLISGSLEETERGELEGFFTVEMESIDDFRKISRSIRSVPEVLSIAKVQSLQNRSYS